MVSFADPHFHIEVGGLGKVVRNVQAPGPVCALTHYLATFGDDERPVRIDAETARIRVGPHAGKIVRAVRV